MSDLDQAIRDRLHMGARAIARELGVTVYAVRTRMDALGLKSIHGLRKAALAAARTIQVSDDELIAQAIAAGRLTKVPTGYACGLSRWESALWTAGANSASTGWRDQQIQRNKNAGTAK
jgi:hypothetical protein